jgi:hypothetical protein
MQTTGGGGRKHSRKVSYSIRSNFFKLKAKLKSIKAAEE